MSTHIYEYCLIITKGIAETTIVSIVVHKPVNLTVARLIVLLASSFRGFESDISLHAEFTGQLQP